MHFFRKSRRFSFFNMKYDTDYKHMLIQNCEPDTLHFMEAQLYYEFKLEIHC